MDFVKLHVGLLRSQRYRRMKDEGKAVFPLLLALGGEIAGKTLGDGVLRGGLEPYSVEEIADAIGLSSKFVQRGIDQLLQVRMLSRTDDGALVIEKWDEKAGKSSRDGTDESQLRDDIAAQLREGLLLVCGERAASVRTRLRIESVYADVVVELPAFDAVIEVKRRGAGGMEIGQVRQFVRAYARQSKRETHGLLIAPRFVGGFESESEDLSFARYDRAAGFPIAPEHLTGKLRLERRQANAPLAPVVPIDAKRDTLRENSPTVALGMWFVEEGVKAKAIGGHEQLMARDRAIAWAEPADLLLKAHGREAVEAQARRMFARATSTGPDRWHKVTLPLLLEHWSAFDERGPKKPERDAVSDQLASLVR